MRTQNKLKVHLIELVNPMPHMPNSEYLRLRSYELARKRQFHPAKQITSKMQAKSKKLFVKGERKRLSIEFKDYLSAIAIQ